MSIASTCPDESDARGVWLLLVVLVLAALLRLPGLDAVPPPLNQDEASRGYDAWAILETGADRHGQRWPLFLESFGPGDYTAALTTYITVPFVAILGPTVRAMRLPDALLGVLTVALLYVWLKRKGGVTIALLAAAILAADPWHIALSRTAHESGFAPFFLVLALLALHRSGLLPSTKDPSTKSLSNNCDTGASPVWHRGPEARATGGLGTGSNDVAVADYPAPAGSRAAAWAFLAGLMLAAHTWAYPATRLFTPLFCIALAVIYRTRYFTMLRHGGTRKTLLAVAVGLPLGALPLIIVAITHPECLAARSRATLLIHEGLPPTEIIWAFVRNFAANLDPRYLFGQADEMSGASIPNVGLHLPVLAPFFVIGLIRVVAGWKRSAWSRLLVVWLVLYPLPAAMCADWNPHPMRTVGGMVLFPIITAAGAHWLISHLAHRRRNWQRLSVALAVVAVAANLAHFANAYYRQFPLLCRRGYQTALVEAVQYVGKRADDADFVLVTNYSNQPYIYVLLYAPIGPKHVATMERSIAGGARGFHQVLRIGKYYFWPRDNHDNAFGQFDEAWKRLPPDARGFMIDVKYAGQLRPGEVLAQTPVGAPGSEGQICEIRRCRCSDIPRWRPPIEEP